jgi:hypothetical protein
VIDYSALTSTELDAAWAALRAETVARTCPSAWGGGYRCQGDARDQHTVHTWANESLLMTWQALPEKETK